MYIFPAIDLYDGKAVRLYKGDYTQMTVYSDNPIEIARDFEAAGARFIHMVDLEGARDGSTPNLSIVADVAQNTSLFVEIGGGIRDMETVEKYLSAGVSRVILGTAAVNNEDFLREAVAKYGERIAVGADVKDGYIAIKGWLEQSAYTLEAFMEKMQAIGVKTIICTDISKDGAMKGTNRELYRELSQRFSMDIVASGGVSTMEDIHALTAMNLYGAIIGKAYYTGAIDLAEAIRAAGEKEAQA
ncbi:MAG: 1-(5-phosphoribosyl)-5-[Clostridia bacterium]|nr:1-(5-phosphoribosyl)-5-[(5-phosphoribosylamino)methylideneamino]imidazole-4-carboxamide isomerase [Clostridia bacterium]